MSINRLRGVVAESKFRCDRRGLAPNGKRSASANGERELRAEMLYPDFKNYEPYRQHQGEKNEKEEENSLAQNLIHIPHTRTVNIN